MVKNAHYGNFFFIIYKCASFEKVKNWKRGDIQTYTISLCVFIFYPTICIILLALDLVKKKRNVKRHRLLQFAGCLFGSSFCVSVFSY